MCSWVCKSCRACCSLLPAFRGRRPQQPALPTAACAAHRRPYPQQLRRGQGLRKALKQACFLLGRRWQTVSSFPSAGSGARLQQAGMWHRWAPWPGRQCQDSTLFAAALTQLSQLCAVAPHESQVSREEEAQLEESGKGLSLHLPTRY